MVATALRIADAEGLPAVSMRRLGAELGVATMSLYGLVRSKDDLVLAMIDASFAEEPFPTTVPTGWRARLETSARRQWAIYRRRPWLARVVNLTRPQGLDCLLDLADWDLAALEELDLDGPDRLDRHILICTFVRGVAVSLDAEADAMLDTGVDADTWVDRDPLLQRALDQRRSGALGRAGAYDLDLDRLMELGLTSLLDGFAA